MKKILPLNYLLAVAFIAGLISNLNAQITSPSSAYSGKELTQYTNGMVNDTIYFVCAGQTGTLTVTPQSGVAGWNFNWSKYDPSNNAYLPYSTPDNNMPTSTKTGLPAGGYRVLVYEGNGTLVGTYRAWICEILTPASVNVNAITPGCTTLDLVGNVNWGTTTNIYNPPAESTVAVDPNTVITVCFTGTHSWVSEVSYYLVGPPSCGSPLVPLATNLNEALVSCNSGNNMTDLCFSTESTNCFNVCTAATPLTGTFGAFGPTCTPINWSAVNGCNLLDPNWSVYVIDCGFGAPFNVTDATISLSNSTPVTNFIDLSQTSLDALNGFNSTYDGYCSFTPPPPAAVVTPVPIPFPHTYEWSAAPNFVIVDSTTSLNIQNIAVPLQSTNFTLQIAGSVYMSLCGGDVSDTEFFEFIYDGIPPNITSSNSAICSNSAVSTLSATPAGGTWSINNTGIAGNTFNPADYAGLNINVVYTVTSPCIAIDQITIPITAFSPIFMSLPDTVCLNGDALSLNALPTGGTWTINGDPSSGTFNPTTLGVGEHTVVYSIGGICATSSSATIAVVGAPNANITNPGAFCLNDPSEIIIVDLPGGTWSGSNINPNTGLFTPSTAGNIEITYTTTGDCPGIATVTLVVNALPTVNASANVAICNGESTTLTATGASTYTWSPATSPASGASVSASPSMTTPYTVTGTDANQCQSTDQVTVTVNQNPVVNIAPVASICQGDNVQLIATPGLGEYSWDNGSSLSATDISNPTANPNVTTDYTVTVTDANGCTDNATVTVPVTQGDASFVANPEEGLVPLLVTFTPNGVASNYVWNFGNGDSDTTLPGDPSTTSIYDVMNYYTATLTITVQGCQFTTSQTIFAYEDSRVAMVPNIVTPDGDGLNDEYILDLRNMEKLTFVIYNRWGKEIARLDKPGDTWQPSAETAEGTYFYHMNAQGFDGKNYEREGSITVLRTK